MNRMSITFYEEIAEKLEKRKEEKGLSSIAQCVRELVDLGLKIEEAALKKQESSKSNPEIDEITLLKNLSLKNLAWSAETRLLTRYLVENMPHQTTEKNIEILKKCKEKAEDFVNKLPYSIM